MFFNSLRFSFFCRLCCSLLCLTLSLSLDIDFFLPAVFYMAFVPNTFWSCSSSSWLITFRVSPWSEPQTAPKNVASLQPLVQHIAALLFKYFGFINHNAELISSWMGFQFKPLHLDIILPIGLFVPYLPVNELHHWSVSCPAGKRPKGIWATLLTMCCFPQMVAGPIERYETTGNELRSEKKINYLNLSNGFKLVLFGLMGKNVHCRQCRTLCESGLRKAVWV